MKELIKRKRIEKGLTQTELAKKINTSQAIVWQWENGKYKPSSKKMIDLCTILGIEFKDLEGCYDNDIRK